jgi:anti-sigma factor RsiW
MADANCRITAEFISDYAAGRLDVEDMQVLKEAIIHDKAIAAAVATACRLDARMTRALAASKLGVSRPRLSSSPAGTSG